jgi:hypothetical protein
MIHAVRMGAPRADGTDHAQAWRRDQLRPGRPRAVADASDGRLRDSEPFAWNDVLFITSGAGGDSSRPIVAVRAGASGDITVPDGEIRTEHVAWFDERAGGTCLPTPVIYKNGLYVLNNTGIFARYNAETGTRSYQARVGPATFTASLGAYNGHVFGTSEDGTRSSSRPATSSESCASIHSMTSRWRPQRLSATG